MLDRRAIPARHHLFGAPCHSAQARPPQTLGRATALACAVAASPRRSGR